MCCWWPERGSVEEGLEAAINDRPRPGQERKLDGKQEAHLIAIACSAAPAGHTHWTLQLLADQVVELEFGSWARWSTERAGPVPPGVQPGASGSVFRRDLQATEYQRAGLPWTSRTRCGGWWTRPTLMPRWGQR